MVTLRESGKSEVRGTKWCFEGSHTHADLPPGDKRRVFARSASLLFGPTLQKEIDELPLDIETLTIATSGFYDDSMGFKLDRPLPKLQKLQLIDICFSKINLNPSLTPNLRSLRMQNVPQRCELTVILPELREVEVHYWSGNESSMRNMLSAATKLESFTSYKLCSNQKLSFASPELVCIDLQRSDSLSALSIWAPKLFHFGLQACYNIETIDFLESHPLASSLPPNFKCTTRMVVNTVNAVLSHKAKRALHNHPRAVPAMHQNAGLATESAFAQMRGTTGGDDYDWYNKTDWPRE